MPASPYTWDRDDTILDNEFAYPFYADAYWETIGMRGAYNSIAVADRAIMALHGALTSEIE